MLVGRESTLGELLITEYDPGAPDDAPPPAQVSAGFDEPLFDPVTHALVGGTTLTVMADTPAAAVAGPPTVAASPAPAGVPAAPAEAACRLSVDMVPDGAMVSLIKQIDIASQRQRHHIGLLAAIDYRLRLLAGAAVRLADLHRRLAAGLPVAGKGLV